MKERPIIFSGEMVRAILVGLKTQTRRPVKHSIPLGILKIDEALTHSDIERMCPFGRLGSKLWVRETYRVAAASGYMPENGPNKYEATIEYKSTYERPINGNRMGRTVELPEMNFAGNLRVDGGVAWRPSIHMPRWASRITLEITDVRAERVQEIREKDSRAEGIFIKSYGDYQRKNNVAFWQIYRHAFKEAWNSIYGPDAWDRNDWVWVIEFKRIGEV